MNFKVLWQKSSLLLIIGASVLVGLIWGYALVPIQPSPTPTPYPTYTPYPTSTPYPTHTPVGQLIARVDICDAVTREPVRGDVWLTFVRDEESVDILVQADTSLIEFPLPGPEQADKVVVKVQSDGYRLWALEIEHNVIVDRLLLLSVMLERIDDA